MSRWFRFHADAIRNPKVARLSDAQFRLWVELMALAAENDGTIPCIDDLKHILKRRLDHLSRGLKGLISAGLMDALDDGYEPHNWSKHQYKSDVSTNRVAKHRAKRNVSETPPDTDTDTDIYIGGEKEEDGSIRQAALPHQSNGFPQAHIDPSLSHSERPAGRATPAKPDGVSDQVWKDFLMMRKAKRAPLTETAMKAIEREAEKARWPLNDALAETVARGWQGFKAAWVGTERPVAQTASAGSSPLVASILAKKARSAA